MGAPAQEVWHRSAEYQQQLLPLQGGIFLWQGKEKKPGMNLRLFRDDNGSGRLCGFKVKESAEELQRRRSEKLVHERIRAERLH